MNLVHRNEEWVRRARKVLPAGGFGNFDPGIVIREGKGSRVWDEDGKEYIDYLIGSGPMLLGHGHPEVTEAVIRQLSRGTTFFASNPAAIELAEEICAATACAEQVRYVSTGGEADMYAMRLARAYTGRSKIVKFEGGYHGMSSEALMSLAPTTLKPFPEAVPDSAGIPGSVQQHMVIAPFNDLDALATLIDSNTDDIAAVIMEPLQRLIPPVPGYLEGVRKLTKDRGILLIFDEVVTGFRLAYGGAQEAYGVVPDLCTLGKIIGGGFPLAAIAGRREVMAHFDRALVGDAGFALQIGTLSGNPVAAVAGLKTMEILRRDGSYDKLRSTGQAVMDIYKNALDEQGIAHQVVGDPTLFDLVFTDKPVTDYRDVLGGDPLRLKTFNAVLRQNGIFKSPGKTYPSLALTKEDIAHTRVAVRTAAATLVRSN